MKQIMEYNQWIKYLEEKATKLPKIQSSLSNFEVLPRLGRVLNQKANECNSCKNNWQKLQEATEKFDLFFDDNNNYINNFDNVVNEATKHLKKEHNIIAKGYTVSVYSLMGMIIGTLLGALTFFVDKTQLLSGMIIGWTLGTFVFWFIGKFKESKLKRNNLIF